jgi:hypothetical protein
MTLSFTDAFRAFGATLANPQWAYSSIAKDGALVISCWKNLLTQHLREAFDRKLDVRLVIASTDQPDVVDRGEEASTIKKSFHIKENVVGQVTLFDNDNFVIEFRQKPAVL